MLIPETLDVYGRTWTSKAVVKSILKCILDEFLILGQLNIFFLVDIEIHICLGEKKKEEGRRTPQKQSTNRPDSTSWHYIGRMKPWIKIILV